MKPDQVNKLYKQLTPTEQANLAIDAMKRQDAKDIELIRDSVERVDYSCPHKDFIQQIHRIERLGLHYGIEYWKTQALATLALKYHTDEINEPTNPELPAIALASWKTCLAKLHSMELALSEVCTQSQLDITAVKWLAQVEDNELFFPTNLLESTEYLEFYTKLFNTAVMVNN
jgi:hypothetical protein